MLGRIIGEIFKNITRIKSKQNKLEISRDGGHKQEYIVGIVINEVHPYTL